MTVEAGLRYSCWTKAIAGDSGAPERSLKWVGARRAQFKIYSDRIECGDWLIPFAEIQNATAFKTRTLFFNFTVLRIETADQRFFQFGFNPWAYPERYMPVRLALVEARLKTSVSSLVFRLVVILWLASIVYRKLY